jgi:hypothetical protein
MRRRIALQSTACECFTTAVSFREAFGVRTRRRVALIGDR